jgi:HD-GYP domain-containing protein (c-di-GMP phosphodiesterase class II)
LSEPVSEIPDLNQADSYLDHLAQMSEITQVLATEDIRNEFGVLLVAKGTPIKKSVSDRLNGHRMEKPIDQVIAIEDRLDSQQLEQDIRTLIEQYPDFSTIQKALDFDNKLKHLCSVSNIPLLLLQKISVLKERLEPVYHRALFSAWFGSLLANEMQWEAEPIKQVFLAGLYHDLGLLHLPPDLIHLEKFSEQQWRLMRSHPYISKQVVENAYLYDQELLVAIAQHHERCDGTGYPKKLTDKSLGLMGQIIALCDNFYNIRANEFEQKGKTLLDFKPYLQVNTDTYFQQTSQAAFNILIRSGLNHEQLHSDNNFQQTLDKLLKRSQRFLEISQLSEQFLKLLQSFKLGRNGVAIQSTILRSNQIIRRSGLIGEEIEKWLAAIDKDEFTDCAEELMNIEALQLELLWLAKKASRMMPAFFHEELPETVKKDEAFKQVSKKMEKLMEECWQL